MWKLLWHNCSPVCGLSAQWLNGGTDGNLLQENLHYMPCLPGLLQPESLSLSQATADPCHRKRHSNTQRQVWLSLWCAQGFAWALRASPFILFTGFSRQEYDSGLPFSSPVDHILSELSIMTCLSWVALHGMAHSFIELGKAVVHVISLISFLGLWFSFCLSCDGEGREAHGSFLMGEMTPPLWQKGKKN